MRTNGVARRFVAGLLLLGVTACAQAADIMVSDAWIREGPPTARVLAAYLTLKNAGRDKVHLTGAASDAFDRVEIHRTEIQAGMMHMMPQDKVPVAPGESVAFEPGGYHLMLTTPKRTLRAGDSITLRLVFDNGETVSVDAPVRKGAAGHRHEHRRHDSP